MINQMKQEMEQVLHDNILNYWMTHAVDRERGGFYGRIDGHGQLHADADRGAVLHARILWAFAAAYRVTGREEYLDTARWALSYLTRHFVDHEQGGVYWSLHADGTPADTKKQTYAIGFAIYGLSEYVRATGDAEALRLAVSLYHDLEEHALDRDGGGYVEALTRHWQPLDDMRLSDKDENGARTMNTHLHVIEPYTNLYRVWPSASLRQSLTSLLDIFSRRLLNAETHHLDLFFDERWQGRRNIQSFGHDIEASWLLHETALVLGDASLTARIEPLVRRIARAADEGLQPDGSMIYERWTDSGRVDRSREWWVMCECIIGHVNLYQHFGDEEALDVARRCWHYVRQHLIDWQQGEWYWGVDAEGRPNLEGDKAGFWKCPYHNTRMCLEVIERAKALMRA